MNRKSEIVNYIKETLFTAAERFGFKAPKREIRPLGTARAKRLGINPGTEPSFCLGLEKDGKSVGMAVLNLYDGNKAEIWIPNTKTRGITAIDSSHRFDLEKDSEIFDSLMSTGFARPIEG